MTDKSPSELRSNCTRFLSGHKPQTPREWLERLAASPAADFSMDFYNEGPAIRELEKELAEILGKESALFMPKGVIAQQIALRVWADRARTPNVVLHPKSHIDLDEANAYQRLAGLVGVRVGRDHLPFTAADLEAVHGPLAAVTVELPLRRAAYKLPTWDELTAIADWCKERQVPLHFDGARLWESAPHYFRSYAELAALADSVYVSFYKGLGGLGGCVLAGNTDFINEVKAWRTRFGGSLYTAFPYIISAIDGLHHHLPKMKEYHQKAREIAAALAEVPGLIVTPDPPHTSGFQVLLPGEKQALLEACYEIAETERAWLFGWLDETVVPGVVMGEVVVGEATEDWTVSEIAEMFSKLLELSKKAG